MTLEELSKEVEDTIYSNEYNVVKFHNVDCPRATLEEIQFLIERLQKEGNLQKYIVSPEAREVFQNCNIKTGDEKR